MDAFFIPVSLGKRGCHAKLHVEDEAFRRHGKGKWNGFTPIELLVVIAIFLSA